MQMTCPILPRRQFVKTAALLICGVTSVALPGCSLGAAIMTVRFPFQDDRQRASTGPSLPRLK